MKMNFWNEMNDLKVYPKLSIYERIIIALISVMTGFFILVAVFYGSNFIEYTDQQFWTHDNALEFINLPVKNGEIVQRFQAGYDEMDSFILDFDNFTPADTAVLVVNLEDLNGNVLYHYECPTSAFGDEPTFYLLGKPEHKLHRHAIYELHILLDSPGSDITVRSLKIDENAHESVRDLYYCGDRQDDKVLYFFQSYVEEMNYGTLWIIICGCSLGIILILCFKNERLIRIWRVASIPIVTIVSYIIIQKLDGNLDTVFTKFVWFNLLIIFSAFMIVKAVFPKLSFYLFNIFVLILSIGNYYVLQFRGTELIVSDIKAVSTAMSVMPNYHFRISPQIITAFIITICLIMGQMVVDHAVSKRKTTMRIYHRLLLFMAGICVLYMIYSSDETAEFKLFSIKSSFAQRGYCYSNLCMWKLSDMSKPEKYSDTQISRIISEIKEPEERVNAVTPGNLIVIMNESLSDLGDIGKLQTNEDFMPFIHSLEKNTIKGQLQVSTFGGGTSITEYEFLTGNAERFFPLGANPYSSFCQDEEEGIVSTLKAQGYYTVAMHPYGPANWNRNNVYPAMGFDEFIDETGYEGAELIRNYVSDQSDYDKIINYYEEYDQDAPLFIFNVTMQNHGGYDINNGLIDKTIFIENMEDTQIAENYLSLIKESDSAFEYLISYFSKVNTPTMIVMFGDHLPRLSDQFLAELLQEQSGLSLAERNYLLNMTPYIIWTNYTSDFEQVDEISANYLGSYVLYCAGLKLTDYNKFLLQYRKELPVIGLYGIKNQEGEFLYNADIKEGNLLSDYEIMEYLRVKDRKSKFYSIFQLDK